MNRIVFLAVIIAIVLGCKPTPPDVTFVGGNGSNFDNAVLIKGATELTGIPAEYGWLAKQYPGYRKLDQSTIEQNQRLYDVIRFTTREGIQKNVYFDITEFYGK